MRADAGRRGAPSMPDMKLPMFVVGAERDHIAPWHSVFKLHHQNDGELTFVLTSGGHNAGVISKPGHPRRHFRIRVRPAAARSVRMNGSATRRPKMGPGGWSGMHGSTGTLAGASIRHRWGARQSAALRRSRHLRAGKISTLPACTSASIGPECEIEVWSRTPPAAKSDLFDSHQLSRSGGPVSVVFVIVCRPRAGTMNRLNLCRR